MKLTEQEREFRIRAVQAAVDNNRLEGLSIDKETMALFNAWIDNQISFDEVKRSIYEICGVRPLH
ncbi:MULTISPECIES: antitoxin VbhA family protein [unclassified Mannheimia]|uniref:antitoxin VbhA family protein n=1 Tax=unclassified Mannheimia TaxID=2645054 RepID=UPI00359CCD95